ncbi:MAG: GDP-mannose 4,6-dehydratase [candidate division NC10 bacterium]|nr:GDP-mannose 4,6-dehydratase [candidate division NC10 bacterium]
MNSSKPFWRDRTVFVTGCTGLLGSWVVEELIAVGANVVGLIRDRVPMSRLASRALDLSTTTVHGAVEDHALLERVLNEYEVDTIFHLAAQTLVTVANQNPLSTFSSNIEGTWNLLEACRRNPQVRRIIVASSDKAYGDQPVLPYTEDMPLQGRHPYDVSKSCADLIAKAYSTTYGLPVCVTRCGNLYGGGDLNFNRIIPGTIRAVLRGDRPIIRSDGKSVRDYFYVRDAAKATLLLAEQLEPLGLQGGAFNFSNESQLSVLEVCHRVLQVMGAADIEPIILGEAHGEIQHQYLSAKKAHRVLGWRPAYSLDEGLHETVAWYREHLNALAGMPVREEVRGE